MTCSLSRPPLEFVVGLVTEGLHRNRYVLKCPFSIIYDNHGTCIGEVSGSPEDVVKSRRRRICTGTGVRLVRVPHETAESFRVVISQGNSVGAGTS